MRGWRRALFGDAALDLVNGRLALSVEHGALRLRACGGSDAPAPAQAADPAERP